MSDDAGIDISACSECALVVRGAALWRFDFLVLKRHGPFRQPNTRDTTDEVHQHLLPCSQSTSSMARSALARSSASHGGREAASVPKWRASGAVSWPNSGVQGAEVGLFVCA